MCCLLNEQVLDWIRIVVDAHYARLVVGGASTERIAVMLQSLQELTEDQTSLCESMEGLRGVLSHLIHSEPLPAVPIPEYSIELVRF